MLAKGPPVSYSSHQQPHSFCQRQLSHHVERNKVSQTHSRANHQKNPLNHAVEKFMKAAVLQLGVKKTADKTTEKETEGLCQYIFTEIFNTHT